MRYYGSGAKPHFSAQAADFHGPRDPDESGMHFVIETGAGRGKIHHKLPFLPSGTLVAGLPAAVMSYCQVRACSSFQYRCGAYC